MERLADRLAARPGATDRRRESVEHPCGSIERLMGQGTFLNRRLENASAQFSRAAMAHNMRRAPNFAGFPLRLPSRPVDRVVRPLSEPSAGSHRAVVRSHTPSRHQNGEQLRPVGTIATVDTPCLRPCATRPVIHDLDCSHRLGLTRNSHPTGARRGAASRGAVTEGWKGAQFGRCDGACTDLAMHRHRSGGLDLQFFMAKVLSRLAGPTGLARHIEFAATGRTRSAISTVAVAGTGFQKIQPDNLRRRPIWWRQL